MNVKECVRAKERRESKKERKKGSRGKQAREREHVSSAVRAGSAMWFRIYMALLKRNDKTYTPMCTQIHTYTHIFRNTPDQWRCGT